MNWDILCHHHSCDHYSYQIHLPFRIEVLNISVRKPWLWQCVPKITFFKIDKEWLKLLSSKLFKFGKCWTCHKYCTNLVDKGTETRGEGWRGCEWQKEKKSIAEMNFTFPPKCEWMCVHEDNEAVSEWMFFGTKSPVSLNLGHISRLIIHKVQRVQLYIVQPSPPVGCEFLFLSTLLNLTSQFWSWHRHCWHIDADLPQSLNLFGFVGKQPPRPQKTKHNRNLGPLWAPT